MNSGRHTFDICVGRTSAEGIEKSQYRLKVFCNARTGEECRMNDLTFRCSGVKGI